MNDTGNPETTAISDGVTVQMSQETWDDVRAEIDKLRALVTRLTNVAADLASESKDPGAEALTAIYCGRNFIYG